MTVSNGALLGGALFTTVGGAFLIWRLFAGPPSKTPRWLQTPSYVAGLSQVAVGLPLIGMGIALSNGLRETPAVLVFLGGLALGLVASACGLLLLVPAWDSGVEWALEHGKFFPPWRSTIGGALAIVGVTTGGVLLPIIVILSR